MNATGSLTAEQLQQFHNDGYLVIKGFLSRSEAEEWSEHFMELHAAGPIEGYFNPQPVEKTDGDLLKAYPRMLMPHRWDETSKEYLLDARLEPILHDLFGEEPLAAQSMF